MKIGDFYKNAIKFGLQCDPRPGKSGIKGYADSQILFGGLELDVRKIMVGIDIEVGELLLAERIKDREGLDLVLAHHPEGKGYTGLHEVMRLQEDILRQAGIEKRIARKLLDERIWEVERKVLPQNHTRPVDAARLLNIPFMCMHTPADNQVYSFLRKIFADEAPRLLRDAVELLLQIPEYRKAQEINAGPRIILGNPGGRTGRVLFEMTGGTEGPRGAFDKLYRAGIRTLVSMHLSEEHFKKAKDANLNVIIAGHISSDTLGLNLLLDKLEKKAGEEFTVINCSGFTRVKRS